VSWDLWISKKCECCNNYDEAFSGNMTYNVSPMYYEALGEEGLRGLDEKKCSEVVEYLRKGIKEMKSNPEKYKKMNPSNGWGSYEGALELLEKIFIECIKNPDYLIYID
jgi:hypothetical protein